MTDPDLDTEIRQLRDDLGTLAANIDAALNDPDKGVGVRKAIEAHSKLKQASIEVHDIANRLDTTNRCTPRQKAALHAIRDDLTTLSDHLLKEVFEV